ncbi:hypothetical protein Q5P01_021845 [Channa striata]|uniref:Kinesin-like protein KIF20B n=1 Tax=Channa striata TaxID=64152 RepID=A0AA88LUZ4_CHASR|nr:hypothetical protein Q5P01_021845 [Channa striata]
MAFRSNLFRQLKESEKNNASLLNATNKTFLEGSSMLGMTAAAEDKISLEVEPYTKFSVWVSFCEIYNENIHDLLEVVPTGATRRTALRLSQDVKGNAFVKDLRWVPVNGAEEAYKVMKLGKRNQSFSSTRLNQLSSRSHSIFSIRILKIEDTGTPRIHTVSELCLCDLAGSERCAKTHNKGERLKEAGNINTSLLILGKCINALRHNQQAKLLQHVPFRESKLTHYLQGFFCGRGKACMIVNINQCASMYDETVSVLKFSAVAQKVLVLFTRPLPIIPEKSSSEVSSINNTERKTLQGRGRSSLIGWESSLEDVQEDDNDEYEEENSLMEDTMEQTGNEEDSDENDNEISKKVHELQVQLKKERAESLLMEARIRDEISREFSELFSEMQNDYNERLAREREILEERAERRLEIFKNLIEKMARAQTSKDKGAMNTSLDSYSSDLAGLTDAAEAAHKELERNVLELCEHQQVQEELAHKHNGGVSGADDDEEKRKLLFQLQEKSSDVARLEEQVADLQRMAGLGSLDRSLQVEQGRSRERERLQEALAAFETEKKAREDALASLEYQTMAKEEALASLEEERRARGEALSALGELKRSTEELKASLEAERKGKEKDVATLDNERRAMEDAVAALAEVKRSRDEALAALSEERSGKEEAQSILAVERKEMRRLVEDREKRQDEVDALQQEVRELTAKVKAAERQVTSENERTQQALVQQQSNQTQLDKYIKEIQEKTSEIHILKQEVQSLKLQISAASSDETDDQLREEVSELRKNLADEKEKCESKHRQIVELQHELEHAKEQLTHKQLTSNQQLEQFTEKLSQQELASEKQVEELRKKLREQEENLQQPLEELRSKLECQQQVFKEEVEQLRAKLVEQTQSSEKQIKELSEKLREQEAISQQQLEELTHKLSEQTEISDKLLDDLKQKLREQEKTTDLLKAELQKSRSPTPAAEELKNLNSDPHTEAASVRVKLSTSQETVGSQCKTATQQVSVETESVLKEKDGHIEGTLSEFKKASELEKNLLEKEALVRSLQKSLKETQERREEEESQAIKEARQMEAERRRELLAVAHEAIAHKDEELEQKAEEISRLKENANQDAEKVKSLSLDLQRKEEDCSDFREKMADYKKQIQQVQKEISAMREVEKTLRQRLADMEKAKNQLQLDVANRDRTIQQLKMEQTSDTVSDNRLQLYQKACTDLEAKERAMEDMRLALTEQEETQEQMEQVLDEKLNLIQELSSEVEKLKGILLQRDLRNNMPHQVDSPPDELKLAKEAASQTQECLRLCTEKHQAERKKWLEEKLSLISQAKEAEDKRNQEMRKFAEDRERHARQQSQLESLSSQLAEKDQTMEKWRQERDTLVAALEIQLKKLLSSQAEKDKLLQELGQNKSMLPQESGDGVAELKSALSEKEAEILQLKEELRALTAKTQTKNDEDPPLGGKPQTEVISRKSGGKKVTRASVSSQGSSGFPSGEENAVTVKITRSARKRKSGEMEKEEVEAVKKRNTRTKLTPKLTPHQEEIACPAGRQDSQSSIRSKKEGTLQKIGDFLQSSPTLLGTKAKKMMSLMSGRGDADSAAFSLSSSSLSLRAKKKKKKLYRPEISSPMDLPSHPIINREPEEKESDHLIIKRRLRSRTAK